ncbi:MAG: hypothetical protein K5907_05725 [Treponema sp.]|nr:hypothetical protein [Treponema sp.]
MKNQMLWPLFKIFSSNSFSLGMFLENFKKGIKGILRNILYIALLGYFIVVAGGLFILIMTRVGNGLVNSGDIEKMPVFIIFAALAAVLFFGFISAATNYYTGSGEEQFLSMPLNPVEIFGAKVAVTAVSDLILGAAIMLVGGIIYGIKAGLVTHPLFYVGLLVTILAVESIAVLVIYTLLLLFLNVIPKLRNRSILTSLATVLLLCFVFAYSLFSSRISMLMDQEDASTAIFVQMIRAWSEKAPILMFFADAISGKIVPILVMAAIFAVIVFALIPLAAPLYIRSLNGFSDVKTKKITTEKAKDVLSKELKTNSIFHTLLVRDIRTIFREPSFFGNGPLMIILVPVMFLISFTVSFAAAKGSGIAEVRAMMISTFSENMTPEGMVTVKYLFTVIIAGICIFMGNCANIASTSFSREGKAIYDLKAMPIKEETIVLVKFWHAMIYCLASIVIIFLFFFGLVKFLYIPFTASDIFFMTIKYAVLTILASFVLIFIEMFIDTINPKLQWENPTAAFKQNMNAVVSTFIVMGFIGLIVLLIVFLPKNNIGYLIVSAIMLVIAAPLGYGYYRYAVKKIPKM